MAKEVKPDELEAKVADAVAGAVTEVPNPAEDAKPTEESKEDENEKLDAQAELFVRRVVDGLTKNLSDLLNPPKPPKKEKKEDSEVKKEVKTKPKTFMTFFGG
jgi:hypothetical protein